MLTFSLGTAPSCPLQLRACIKVSLGLVLFAGSCTVLERYTQLVSKTGNVDSGFHESLSYRG